MRKIRNYLRSPGVALVACVVAVTLLWNTPFLLPLKWLVVLFHELSHAAVGWLTGGQVISLNVTHRQGGICLIAGGNRSLILLAGYPGSLCCGLLAMALARARRARRPALVLLGLLLIAVGVLYVRPWIGFGFPFTVLTGAALVAVGLRATPGWQQVSLFVIGVTSATYAFIDIYYDVFLGSGMESDATLLAEHTGAPGWVWGVCWYAVTALMLVLAVRFRLVRVAD